MRKRVRDHWWKWAAMNPHHFTLIRLAHNVALTTAVQPILIQQIACPTVAVEAANIVGTYLLTTSSSGIALIDICILDRMISLRIVSNWPYQLTGNKTASSHWITYMTCSNWLLNGDNIYVGASIYLCKGLQHPGNGHRWKDHGQWRHCTPTGYSLFHCSQVGPER